MPLFIFEIKRRLKSLLIWYFALFIIMIVASVEFSVYQGDESIREAMVAFEPFFKALGVENLNFTTAIGFLAIFSIYIYLPLTIFSGLLGLTILSKEEHKKTSEFLLTLPLKRTTVLTQKLLSGVLLTVILNMLLHFTILAIFYQYNPTIELISFVFHMSLGVLIIQLIFFSIAFMLGIIVAREKVLNGVFLTLLISTFILNMLIGYLDNAYFLPYLTPFYYFRASLMVSGEFKISYMILSLLLIGLSLGYTYYYYPKKNITL
ncbi:MAG: ABC transporter permease subunit [Candidatus Izemoplasma sp.]|nr:ABC transporter permease subunit [Candidatus Izemoplasma sp.]